MLRLWGHLSWLLHLWFMPDGLFDMARLLHLRLLPDGLFDMARLLDPWLRLCWLLDMVNLRPCVLRPLDLLLSGGSRPMHFMAGQCPGFL